MNRKLQTLRHNLKKDDTSPDIERIGGLFPRGYMSIVAAQAGTGKTWFMQYMACRLSMGGNILGGLVPKSKPMKSVIMSGETGDFLLNKRLAKTCWEYNEERLIVYSAVEMQIADIPIMLNTKEGKATFVEILDEEKPDLMFFDTLISFHAADESKQADMTGIYSFLLKSANAFNCAIVLNHHTRKRSTKNQTARFTQDDVIGTNAGVRLASSVYLLEQSYDETRDNEGMPTVICRNVKSWDKRIPDFSYSFMTDQYSGLIDFGIKWGITPDTANWSLRERFKLFLDSHEDGAILETAQVAGELMTSEDSARRYLEEAYKKGFVEKSKLMTRQVWKVRKQNAD